MPSYNRLLSIYARQKSRMYQNYYDIALLQFLFYKSAGNLKECVSTITLLPKLLCTIKHASKVELKKLFEFATSGTDFLFQGAFYEQTDGVTMGSLLGLVLAKLFMSYYETMWLNTFCECEMILYRRYVDDIICLFNCQFDVDKFFEFLNRQYPNIKFTFKKRVNKQISFLDVLIANDVDQFCTFVFRKKPGIGLFTNHVGFTPFSYKVGLVRTLLHCAFMISGSWFLFNEEIVKIKHYLEKLLSPGFC